MNKNVTKKLATAALTGLMAVGALGACEHQQTRAGGHLDTPTSNGCGGGSGCGGNSCKSGNGCGGKGGNSCKG